MTDKNKVGIVELHYVSGAVMFWSVISLDKWTKCIACREQLQLQWNLMVEISVLSLFHAGFLPVYLFNIAANHQVYKEALAL